MSNVAKDLILALLKVKPEDRLTVEQALRHPWLQAIDGESAKDEDGLALSLVIVGHAGYCVGGDDDVWWRDLQFRRAL